MSALYAEALPQIGAVRVVMDTQDWGTMPDEVHLYRSLIPPDDPEWSLQRVLVRIRPTYVLDGDFPQYGFPWEMTAGGADVWYDTEAPLDVPVYYAAETVGGDDPYVYGHAAVMVVETGFETSLDGWTADAGGAVSLNTTTPLFGTTSLRLTAAGGTATIGARSALTGVGTVATGRLYSAEFAVRAGAAATDIRVAVDWYNAAGVFISSDLGPINAAPAGVVVHRRWVFQAATGASRAQLRVRWGGTPAGAAVIDVDQAALIDMGDGNSSGTATPVTLESQDGGWLSDPARPAGDVRLSLLPVDDCPPDPTGVIFLSHAADQRASAGARFDVVEQAVPSSVTALRKAPTSALTVAALTFDDRDTVHALCAPGDVLMLRVPPPFGVDDRYLDVDDVTTAALSPNLRVPYRVIDLPYAQAASPGSPTAGVLGTRFQDLDRYATWNAFDAANLTSIDLLLGQGSTVGASLL